MGKTTLVRSLLGPKPKLMRKPKWTIGDHVVAAGHYTGSTFDGADTIAYNGVRDALAVWGVHPLLNKPLTILDGDRMSNKTALEILSPVRKAVILLRAGSEVTQGRRDLRGSNQNQTWLKGRITKSKRWYEKVGEAGGAQVVVNANGTEDTVLNEVKGFLETLQAWYR